MSSINSLNLLNLNLIKRESAPFHGLRSAIGSSATVTFVFEDGPFGRVTEAITYSRRTSRHTRDVQTTT